MGKSRGGSHDPPRLGTLCFSSSRTFFECFPLRRYRLFATVFVYIIVQVLINFAAQ